MNHYKQSRKKKTKKIIEGNGNTAHQIWTMLEKSLTMNP